MGTLHSEYKSVNSTHEDLEDFGDIVLFWYLYFQLEVYIVWIPS